MNKKTVLVVGASGMVGSELVRLLKSKGLDVRETTSQKQVRPGQVHVNLATGEGLRDSMEGVEKAFFLSPPGYADQYAMLAPLIQEAKRRGLKKVVLMTAMGANAVETSPFRRAEIELEKSGLTYNIIRPNWFLQNFHTFWIQGIREQRKIQLPAGTASVGFIDARDIAAVAAELLTTDRFDNRDFDLTGHESVNHAQVAAALAKATGLPIQYQEIEPAILQKNLLAAGLPSDYVDFLILIFGFLRQGYSASVNNNVKLITGSNPRGLENYAKEFAQKWK